MNRTLRFLGIAAATGVATLALAGFAATDPRPAKTPAAGQGARRPKKPHPPLERALDVNGDGIIDAAEIANASAALKTLDADGDGRLVPEEYRPPRPPEDDREGPGEGRAPRPQ